MSSLSGLILKEKTKTGILEENVFIISIKNLIYLQTSNKVKTYYNYPNLSTNLSSYFRTLHSVHTEIYSAKVETISVIAETNSAKADGSSAKVDKCSVQAEMNTAKVDDNSAQAETYSAQVDGSIKPPDDRSITK